MSVATSPLPGPSGAAMRCLPPASQRHKFLRRLLQFRQMEFDFALWQMINLIVAPTKVYQNSKFNQGARNVGPTATLTAHPSSPQRSSTTGRAMTLRLWC